MNFKIICTGNPAEGIARAIKNRFSDVTFISRSTGYDLTNNKDLNLFKDQLKLHNIFINNSQVSQGTQELLLTMARDVWVQGHVFNIGSVLEYPENTWISPEIAKEKQNLQKLSLTLNSENFRTTHIMAGSIRDDQDSDITRLDTAHIAETISWILQAKFDVPLISIDKVSNARINYYNSKKSKNEY